ncbi:MAG: hypothetical protein ABI808_07440 [Pseudonocardiales bacterium]
MTEDLSAGALLGVMPGRAVRSYPALLSTEADAQAWARADAPSGALVVADYQASPRGRNGLPLHVTAGQDLGFSLVLRPELSLEREGWPYPAASVALRNALPGPPAVLEWPDTVLDAETGQRRAAFGVHAQLGAGRVDWIVLSVVVEGVDSPRADLLARLVAAVDDALDAPREDVLADYRANCVTLGRHVTALMIPVGPGGPEVTGEAVDVKDDGALVLLTARGSRVAVRPQHLGWLEKPADPD